MRPKPGDVRPAESMRDEIQLNEAQKLELQLIRAASQGDREAFGKLVRSKQDRIVRTARQITGNRDDALDAAQVALVKMWQGLGSYDPKRKFDTWMYRVTVNAAIDQIRSRGPIPTAGPLPGPGSDREPAATDRALDDAIDLGRLREAFERLAQSMAPQQKAVFVLRDLEGLSTAEVAEILEVADSTVRNHLMQARKSLREGLRRDYPEWVPR